MPRRIVMEEFHVTVYVPPGLPDAEYDAIQQTLNDPNFETRLLRAIRRVFRGEAALSKATVRLSR
jgi:hypothetical protein